MSDFFRLNPQTELGDFTRFLKVFFFGCRSFVNKHCKNVILVVLAVRIYKYYGLHILKNVQIVIVFYRNHKAITFAFTKKLKYNGNAASHTKLHHSKHEPTPMIK